MNGIAESAAEMSRASSKSNIVLTGFMGTGKTTIGQLVADRLGWRFVDTDRLIEARAGCSIAQIFAAQGEPAFRALESQICTEVAGLRRTVIATGGGTWLALLNREQLSASSVVICLRATANQLAERLASDRERPLLAGAETIEARAVRLGELLATREAIYATIPHAIDVAGFSPFTNSERVITLWRRVSGGY